MYPFGVYGHETRQLQNGDSYLMGSNWNNQELYTYYERSGLTAQHSNPDTQSYEVSGIVL